MMTITESTLTYRTATTADVKRIFELLKAAHLPVQHADSSLDTTLVAEKDGIIVATGAVEVHGESAVVRSVAVDAALRGGGVGRSLSEALLDLGRQNQVRDLYLFTREAYGFWQKLGFRDTTLEAWPEAARASWQYRFVSKHRELFVKIGVHTMWRSA
jgi:amino-acid N-acetyltransferase